MSGAPGATTGPSSCPIDFAIRSASSTPRRWTRMSTRSSVPWESSSTSTAIRCNARDMARASRMIVRSGRLISGLEGNQPANGVNGKPPPVSGPAEAFALNPSTSPPTGLRTVTSRRRFLGSLVSASAALPTVPALTNDALAHVIRTVGAVAGRPPAAIAEDEDFWREIQNGFTLDRTLINLNNGGGCPPPPPLPGGEGRHPTPARARPPRGGGPGPAPPRPTRAGGRHLGPTTQPGPPPPPPHTTQNRGGPPPPPRTGGGATHPPPHTPNGGRGGGDPPPLFRL